MPGSFDAGVLRLLDGSLRLAGFLARMTREHQISVRDDSGEVAFTDSATGRLLFSTDAKRLARLAAANDLVWTWDESPPIVGRIAEVPESAKDAIGPANVEPRARVFRAASAMDCAAICEWPTRAGIVFLALKSVPDAEIAGLDPIRSVEVLKEGRRKFGIVDRASIEAYLGKPSDAVGVGLTGGTYLYRAGAGSVRIRYDSDGVAQEISTDLVNPAMPALSTPIPSAAAKESPTPRSLLGKFFKGKHG